MVQTSAMATGVAIIGMMKIARSTPRPRKLRENTTARRLPNSSGSQHRQRRIDRVCSTDYTKRGIVGAAGCSWRSRQRFVGAPTFHSFRLIQIVNTHGKTINRDAPRRAPESRMDQ